MLDHSNSRERAYAAKDLISASELREFIFCERSWFLSRRGLPVSPEAESQRAAGIAFHRARAITGRSRYRLAMALAFGGLAILLFQWWFRAR
jgi:hypothetical protein